ncbi:zinc finger MYM-type protein 2-like [Mercenaria mercenaria]|uniref:zinc finger MYM-type protein 2-like n=1 Tax=Mercenaria mercenaria TaxID=6596 RepID=UPI001E1E03C1|nr:zinc finger MYM-type protein 2-like [Mercenaria mercenaria]
MMLLFRSSSLSPRNNYDAKNDTSNQAENKENTQQKCATVCRFQKPLSTVYIKNKQRNAVPANTTRSNIWAINMWKEWAENRNLQPETASEPGFPIPLDIGNFQSYLEMEFWLKRFICEIKRKNGEHYPPATLQNIAAGIQRYLRTEKSMHENLFKTDDPTFAEFR